MTRGPNTPWALLAWATLAGAFFALPLAALALVAPWGDLGLVLRSPAVIDAFRISAVASLGATGAALVLGAPLAWVLARTELPGRGLLRALVTVPLVMPPVVAGAGLLATFGRYGLVGETLYAFGIAVPFTTLACVLAATFVAAPFLITSLEAALARTEPRLEDVARTLGASDTRVLATVTLPQIAPGLRAGLVLCMARALGEFGATITFAGNLRGETQTVPLAIYQALQTGPERAFLLCALLLALSATLLSLARRAPAT